MTPLDIFRTVFRFLFQYFRWPFRRRITAEKRERELADEYELRIRRTSTELSGQIGELQRQLRQEQDNHAAAVRSLQRSLQEQQARSDTQIKQLERERTQLQLEGRALTRQLDEKTKHLEQLGKESSEAQRWMSIRDACTDAQVVADVEGVNWEVQNIATPLADALAACIPENTAFVVTPETSTHVPFSEQALTTLGSIDMDPGAREVLLGIAVQSALVSFCREAALQWDHGFLSQSPEARSWFGAVYDSVYQSEPAAISGNWKALAHRHAGLIATTTHGTVKDQLMRALISAILPIASACGLDSERTYEVIQTSVTMDTLAGLAIAVQTLNEHIKESVISSSLVPVVVTPGTFFNGNEMRVGLGGDETGDAIVMSTTGLGLERYERKEDGSIEKTMLLQPEVALNAVLDQL
ncbi:unnamed protein product [Peniophora sp. CBMAI 1063]|nr:unnamed protein product [Peniophora sp. CBMAI 1063]